MGPESGTRPVPRDFNQHVRELCDEFGALLIFDEVVTGFRLGMGSAQGYFGVKPDLTIFGKCITGGYPMAGGVGGRRDVLMRFAAGIGGTGERAYIGGTLSANPLSCVAGYYALLEMERTNAAVIAGRAGDRLTQGLQQIIEKYHLPFVAYNQGSIVHLETSGVMLLDMRHPIKLLRELKPRKHMIEEMGAAYMSQGLITLAGSRMYTSLVDTDDVIDEALNRFETVLSSVEGVTSLSHARYSSVGRLICSLDIDLRTRGRFCRRQRGAQAWVRIRPDIRRAAECRHTTSDPTRQRRLALRHAR